MTTPTPSIAGHADRWVTALSTITPTLQRHYSDSTRERILKDLRRFGREFGSLVKHWHLICRPRETGEDPGGRPQRHRLFVTSERCRIVTRAWASERLSHWPEG